MAHYTLHISEMNRGFMYIWYNVVPDHFFKKDWSISYAKFIAIEKRGFKNCKNILFNTVNYYFIWMTLFLHIHKSIVMWWIKRRNKECLSLFLKNCFFLWNGGNSPMQSCLQRYLLRYLHGSSLIRYDIWWSAHG